MKKFILAFMLIAGFSAVGQAAGGATAWDKAPKKVTDLASLQNGANYFVNYCIGCHSAAFMRYNRLRDIGLKEEDIKSNLMFTTEKVGDTMRAAINPKEAKEWFGAAPPDLTLVARSRAGAGGSGSDYLYTFLRTFYRDEATVTGWNNLAFPTVGMPHALWELQGQRQAVFDSVEHNGSTVQVFKGWKQLTPGTMTTEKYDDTVADLVNYLQWMGEPAQHQRTQIGVGVLIFLFIFTFIAWRLNKVYWKDIK